MANDVHTFISYDGIPDCLGGMNDEDDEAAVPAPEVQVPADDISDKPPAQGPRAP